MVTIQKRADLSGKTLSTDCVQKLVCTPVTLFTVTLFYHVVTRSICGALRQFTRPRRQPNPMTKLWLHPNVHTFSRSDDEIQLGIHPEHAVIMSANATELLRMCNGQFSTEEVCRQLESRLPNIRQIIDVLLQNHLIFESSQFVPHHPVNELQRLNHFREVGCTSDVARNRGEIEISIHGAGRLGTTIAMLLASSGIPQIRVHDDRLVTGEDVTAWGASRVDIGSRRDRVCGLLMERVNRGALHRQLHPRMHPTRRLAVIVMDQSSDWPWLDPLAVDAMLESSTPHLVATTSHSAARWTNVITPGENACTRCEYQRLVDIDSHWPLITAQLRNRSPLDLAPASLVLMAATHVVGAIHNWMNLGNLDSGAHTLQWPSLTTSFTPWSQHPLCGCGWG